MKGEWGLSIGCNDLSAKSSLNSKRYLSVYGRSYLNGKTTCNTGIYSSGYITARGNVSSYGKSVVKDGDGIRIKNGQNYLNKTATCCTNASGSSGGAYWKNSHDADADLRIWRR